MLVSSLSLVRNRYLSASMHASCDISAAAGTDRRAIVGHMARPTHRHRIGPHAMAQHQNKPSLTRNGDDGRIMNIIGGLAFRRRRRPTSQICCVRPRVPVLGIAARERRSAGSGTLRCWRGAITAKLPYLTQTDGCCICFGPCNLRSIRRPSVFALAQPSPVCQPALAVHAKPGAAFRRRLAVRTSGAVPPPSLLLFSRHLHLSVGLATGKQRQSTRASGSPRPRQARA